MNELLKVLYDTFYKRLPEIELRKEIESCHQQLIEALDKPNRRLVLRIIDAKDQIAEDTALDSFIAGFLLAWQLEHEVHIYSQCNGQGKSDEH